MKKLTYISVLFSLFFILILPSCDFLKKKHADVVLLGEINVIVHDQWYGYIEYIGEVKNIGNATAEMVEIKFNTYNKNNELISVDSKAIALFLEHGEEAGFELHAYCDVEQYDHYTYNIKWSEAD